MATTPTPITGVPIPTATSTDQVPADLLTAFTAAEKQFVMRFASAAARDAAIPSPVKGMTAWLDSPGVFSEYLATGWKNRYTTGVQMWGMSWPSVTVDGINGILTNTLTVNPNVGPYKLSVSIGMQTALAGSGVPFLEMYIRGSRRASHNFVGVTGTMTVFSATLSREFSITDGGSCDIVGRLSVPFGVNATSYTDDSNSFVSVSAVPM